MSIDPIDTALDLVRAANKEMPRGVNGFSIRQVTHSWAPNKWTLVISGPQHIYYGDYKNEKLLNLIQQVEASAPFKRFGKLVEHEYDDLASLHHWAVQATLKPMYSTLSRYR